MLLPDRQYTSPLTTATPQNEVSPQVQPPPQLPLRVLPQPPQPPLRVLPLQLPQLLRVLPQPPQPPLPEEKS